MLNGTASIPALNEVGMHVSTDLAPREVAGGLDDPLPHKQSRFQ
ncbi:MAG: hypothetical protein ACI96M_000430 [Candidatus Azotimanducaceae bacterium]|jgi:hypothetical protein